MLKIPEGMPHPRYMNNEYVAFRPGGYIKPLHGVVTQVYVNMICGIVSGYIYDIQASENHGTYRVKEDAVYKIHGAMPYNWSKCVWKPEGVE